MSIIARRRMARMPFPAGTEIISVMREGQALNAQPSDGLKAGDVVMLMSRTDDLPSLDRLFAARKARAQAKGPGTYDFTLDPDANAGEVADMYGFLVTPHERDHTLASLMHARLGREIERGSRISTGAVQLVALSVDDDGSPQKIGLDLDPPPPQSTRTLIRLRVNEALRSVRELFLADPRN
nr:hypothetical protein DBT41_16185 [Aerococcus urinae]